ncbi:L-arabinitol 4-dehydrogenase [Colletotrichum scovillei]|uniref:L-arabinitol 4-dehydrogenase n=1 Tax=Colletotrichum scovillei TaxID=1209932 RepID=A0A9P7UCW1_9PEZI|nr:L-arabinitol 4-dehydrogenase [Colletotrichum scovillei]KAG7057052.1 L-arabinitol 4-dehydrogenase [Colletotrichum scovillei]KAG7066964.1 L-arabinitol 4-dehydrogenase [Colletotrichum scovillei]
MDTSNAVDILRRKPDNLAIYTNPEHELYLKKLDVPTPSEGECLIHVRATGICGSDVHFWKAGHIGKMVVTGENGLGHESAGVVVGVGPKVMKFKIGNRVAIECGIPYMKVLCFFYYIGRYNAYLEVVFYSTLLYYGTLTRYYVHLEDWLHKIPDGMLYEEGSLLEPLLVALTGLERSGVRLGDPVVICGSGPIGITTLLAASVATAEDIKGALGEEAKIVLECTGVESSVVTGIYCCRFGGMVFVIGCGRDLATIPIMYMAGKEIELRFQFRYRDIYPRAIGLVAEGVIDLKPLVTHRFALEDGEKAFKTASDPSALALKVQVLDD